MMLSKRLWKLILAGGLVGLFTGCASVLSDQVREQSEPSISFQALQGSAGKYNGKMVILGGTIIQVNHGPSGSVLEILQRPLGSRLEPEDGDQTRGRFLIRANRVIEDHIFRTGRLITVAGIVSGLESRQLDQTVYEYPVISLEEYHLWPEQSPYEDSNPKVHFSIGIFKSF